MIKYKSHSHSTNAICPYCGSSYQVESEDCAFEARVELCDDCEKYYLLESFVDVTHRTSPNCELNGDDHDWEEKATHKVCRVCGKVAPR